MKTTGSYHITEALPVTGVTVSTVNVPSRTVPLPTMPYHFHPLPSTSPHILPTASPAVKTGQPYPPWAMPGHLYPGVILD